MNLQQLAWINPRTAWKKWLKFSAYATIVTVTVIFVGIALQLYTRVALEALLGAMLVGSLWRSWVSTGAAWDSGRKFVELQRVFDAKVEEEVAKRTALHASTLANADHEKIRLNKADLAGQLLVIAGQCELARKTKKAHKIVGNTKLDAAYYLNRFEEVAKKRWPNHPWTPDQIATLATIVGDKSDLTRWRMLVEADLPPTV